MNWLILLSLIPLLSALFTLVVLCRVMRTVPKLEDDDSPTPARWPEISVIVPARDEADTIGSAMRAMLELDYPALEIIAVDDRSSDGTGAVLDALAAQDPRLHVVHIEQLPEGWVGKSHAMHSGAQRAEGEYLLFTDADVHFAPDTLKKAMALMLRKDGDHMGAMPDLVANTLLMRACLMYLAFVVYMFVRPESDDPESGVGFGPFNLIRRGTYDAIGGFASLAMTAIDDFELGQMVKRRGYRQLVVMARKHIAVTWHPSVRHMIRNMEKNTLAVFDYRWTPPLVGALINPFLGYWPIAGLIFTEGVAWWLNLAAYLLMLVVGLLFSKVVGWRSSFLWFAPAAVLVNAYGVLRALWLTKIQGGIYWRDTFYPLQALKAAHASRRR